MLKSRKYLYLIEEVMRRRKVRNGKVGRLKRYRHLSIWDLRLTEWEITKSISKS